MTITTIPAQPGFDLVSFHMDKFSYYPIIAWAVETEEADGGIYQDSTVYPICIAWSANGRTQDNIIRRPDGTIECEGQVFLKGHEQEALEFAEKRAKSAA
jgi:hypothetical protein